MRRPAAVIGLFLVCCTAACTLRRQVAPASPYCRGGNPLAGVYQIGMLESGDLAVARVHLVLVDAVSGDIVGFVDRDWNYDVDGFP